MNVVMTGQGRMVEVQGTAEQGSFERSELDTMIDLATKGISELAGEQDVALGAPRAD
jgi:ribonuclease PH